MIAKITTGSSGRALVSYLFGKGKANEHTDQRVITSGLALGGDALVGGDMTSEAIAELGGDLDAANAAFGADPAGGHIWHLSLSLAAQDRQLSDDQWADIARAATEAIGFERAGLSPAAWVAVGHGTSVAGNQHIHIAASLVRLDGSRVDTGWSKRTMSTVCADLEQRYGLYVVEGRTTKGMPGLTRGELARTEREQTPEPARTTLARTVREASVTAKDEAEFVRRLKGAGLVVRPRYAGGGKDAVVGYAVGVKGNLTTDGGQITFGGGKLGPDLTLPRLRQYWESGPEDREAAVAQWGASKPLVQRGREASGVAATDWQRMAKAIERTNAQLQTIPVEDRATWAGAARGASGVFAGWSRRIEGGRPGPLAHAADALASSAQVAPDGPIAELGPAISYRGPAMTAIQGTLRHDSATGWAMLLVQLQRTLDLVASAHEARGERLQAERLVAISSGELDGQHRRFKETPIAALAGVGKGTAHQAVRSDLLQREEAAAFDRRAGPAPGRDFER